MEASGKLLSSRLISLFKNGQWRKDDVVTLFKTLVEQYKGRNEYFHTWMMSILHKVEIHKISVSDLKENDKMVDHVETKINDIAENNNEKTLDEIVQEICGQSEMDEQTMEKVHDIVLSVSRCLSASTAPHLQDIKQSLFKLCKAVEKTMKYTPRVTQMVSWCILVLSESSLLVQVLTGEGKSCIVAMFAAHQVMMGKTPDIISSSTVLAERDAEQWFPFYKELDITIDVNTNTPKDLKKCYECQVVYGTTDSFAGDFLRQRFQRGDVRPKREFQCVIVDEVDSLMLDKGPEVVYLNSHMPLMEPLNATLAEIWLIVNQLKRLETGEILGPIQLFSEVLSEIMHENENIDQLRIVQMAVDAGIIPTKPLMQMQEPMTNVLKQLDNASVLQMMAFLTTLVRNFPQYFFKLYQQEPDGTLRKQNEISSAGTNKRQEISLVLQENGKCHVVHFDEDSLVKSLGEIIKKGCQSETKKEQNESRIPGLQDLINGKMQTWIENALLATKMNLGHEYILHGNGVVPVDYKCTGVVQNNMRWGEGLQQFLEMKHQTKLSNMSLITNFMSNVCLFNKYSNQIYGITGTLGDQTELDMLKELYKGIKTCKIPSFKQRKLYELEGMVIPEEDEWIRTVCKVVKNEVSSTVYRGPRAALVICETINRAEMLHRALAKTITKDKLKLYVNNNMDNSKIINSTVHAGNVIIATNLAGRGTDLKVCKTVNEAGGLFVVQTFLPLNVRVEQQAFGRTARQGSPGSAQLFMCTSHLSDSVKQVMRMTLNTSVTSLLKRLSHLTSKLMSCDSTENLFEDALNHYLENHSFQNHEAMVSALTHLLTMKSFSSQDLEEAKKARNIMVKFRLSRFLEKYIPKITKEEKLFSVYLDVLDNVYEDDVFSDQRDVFVSCLHECWALWFLMYFNEETSIETLKKQLEKDLSNAKQKLLIKQSPSTMVYYYIRSGDNLREKGCFAESIEMYTKALEDGVCWEYIPLCNRALATVMKKDGGYIAKALPDLDMAEKAIDSYKSQLSRVLTCVKPRSEDKTLLTEQFRVKMIIADLLKTNIQDAVMELKRAESTGRVVNQTGKHHFVLPIDILIRHASSMEGNGNQPEDIFKRILELSIEELKSEFNRNHQTLTKQIKDLNDITDNLESMHKNTTKGSLVGSSIGAAGGVSALVGLALAPFTFGASLALTAAGAVAGVAGGVTGGASNITNAIQQKNLRETIEKIINDFLSTIFPMIKLLSKFDNITEKMEFPKETLKQHKFQRAARGAGDILAHVANVAKMWKMCAEAAKEIRVYVKGVSAMRATTQTAKAVRMSTQTAKAVRTSTQTAKAVRTSTQTAKAVRTSTQTAKSLRTTAAFTGTLSVVFLALDVYSIVQDSKELSEMNQSAHKRNAEEIKSETLKYIVQVKETAAQFKIIVDTIKQTIDTFKSI